MRFGERPAVIWELITRLEIDRIQGQAITTPMAGRAAEIAEPAHHQIIECQTDALALV